MDKTVLLTGENRTDELKTEELQGSQLQPAECDLTAAEGFPCFIEQKTAKLTPIKTAVFVVGFSRNCGLSIEQDALHHTVSRFHATVTTTDDGRQFIRDESTNGTFFGASAASRRFTRLPKGIEVELKDGQYVRFANVLFQFRSGERMPR